MKHTAFTLSEGWLVEGDTVSLSTGLLLCPGELFDTATGAHHQLSKKAWHVLQPLQHQNGIEVSDWFSLCTQLKLSESEIVEILGFLATIAGLRIHRTMADSIDVTLKRFIRSCYGLRNRSVPRRKEATLKNIIIAIGTAAFPLAVTLPVLSVLLYGMGWTITNTFALPLLTLAVLLVSAVVHEYMHVLVVRTRTPRIAPFNDMVCVQRGLRFGILHPRQSASAEVASALLGPFAGIVTAVLLAGVVRVFMNNSYLWYVLGILVSAHTASLLPQFGDGKRVRTIFSEQKAKLWAKTKLSYE